MATLNDRKFSSYILDNSTAAVANINTPYAQIAAGKYYAAYSNLADQEYGFLRLTSEGKLMVDTEITLDGNLMIDNITVWATNIADSTTSGYALIDAAGHPQVDVLSLPGGLTGYAEDTAHVSGDYGIQILAVRNDAYASLTSTDLDYSALSVDSTGKLHTLAQGYVAHDSVDSGNPIKMGGRARSSQLTAVASNDRADLITNLYGEQVIAGFDWTAQAIRSSEIDPISSHHVEETLAVVTNGTDGTYYYYVDMDGFTKLGVQLVISGGSGTVTTTVEGTLQDDGTAPASCTYVDVTTDLFGVASLTASDILVDDGEATSAFKYLRIKIVAATGGANDGDWTIWSKKVYA
jgi:hypothetical protein